ncbi:MAG: 5'-nucleotidase C-terminal domain-containing protein [Actinomycetota bacterium]|nr:5'-nucleotidase C-terminal domain-containing protein [Actinomycetota bacterium]
MRRFTMGVALLAALVLTVVSGAVAAKPAPPPVTIQILNVSDWHGNVDPVANAGGAWNISARWQQDRLAHPSLTLTAGDDIGATPALSSFFNEEPAVKAQRMMGIQVGALGNHNFDRGVAHLQQMIDLAGAPTSASAPGAPYRYVAANLRNLDGNLTGVDPIAYFNVGGAKVAVIGITNEEAPSVVLPGSFGTIEITNGVEAANKFAAIARKAQSDVVIVITHKGVRGFTGGQPFGELIDFANGLDSSLVDVVVGDHTDVQYSGTINDILVHENRSYGATYAKTLLEVQPGAPGEAGTVLSKSVGFVSPAPAGALVNSSTQCPPAPAFCDQAIVDMLVPYRQQLAALLDGTLGTTTAVFARGGNIERRQEVPLGDLIADGMRWRYGTQLALMNGGGIRSTMPACSYQPVNTSLRRPCPGYAAGPPFDIVLGDVFSVLPFGNILNTRTVTGQQIWQALENGVSKISSTGTGADGRFPQISGFKFTFHYLNATGCSGSEVAPITWSCVPSRVTSVALADGTPIPYDGTTYTLALPNFVNLGGDSYTMFKDGQGATQELDAVVMKEYMAFSGPSFDPTSYPLDRITKLP